MSLKRFYGYVDFDVAVNIYGEVAKVDPYNLENMDTYSNILYVKVCTTFDHEVIKYYSSFKICVLFNFDSFLVGTKG